MSTRLFVLVLIMVLLAACSPKGAVQPTLSDPSETSTPIALSESATPEVTPTTIEGAVPSYKVAAFYYPWYGNPTTDSQWTHWTQNNHVPPADIASDYFPALGAYSSNDPKVIAQHMQWLQQADIGVIITSWWGQGSREDQAVP